MGWFKKEKKERKMFTQEEIEEKVKAFIAGKSKLLSLTDIKPDLALFSSGVLDSLAFIELVTFVESEFDIRLPGTGDVNFTALDNLGLIASRVQKALSSQK